MFFVFFGAAAAPFRASLLGVGGLGPAGVNRAADELADVVALVAVVQLLPEVVQRAGLPVLDAVQLKRLGVALGGKSLLDRDDGAGLLGGQLRLEGAHVGGGSGGSGGHWCAGATANRRGLLGSDGSGALGGSSSLGLFGHRRPLGALLGGSGRESVANRSATSESGKEALLLGLLARGGLLTLETRGFTLGGALGVRSVLALARFGHCDRPSGLGVDGFQLCPYRINQRVPGLELFGGLALRSAGVLLRLRHNRLADEFGELLKALQLRRHALNLSGEGVLGTRNLHRRGHGRIVCDGGRLWESGYNGGVERHGLELGGLEACGLGGCGRWTAYSGALCPISIFFPT